MSDSKSRALLTDLDALHAMLAHSFSDELDRCLASGEVTQSAVLAQVRAFLKENGIDTPASAPRIDTLKDAMPDFDAIEANILPFPRSHQ